MTSSIARFTPFAELEALRTALFNDRFVGGLRHVNPLVTDVYTDEGGANLVIEAHLPTFDEENITVSLAGDELVIQANKHEKDGDRGKNYLVRESSSSFYRSVTLPDEARQDDIKARFEKGLLTVTVPLTQDVKPRSVEIESVK